MPLIYPVRPLLAFCSTLSSRGGKATWLRARSKNKGLHGMGWKPGGKCTRLTCLLTREGSRQKVSNRSERGWKRPMQKQKLYTRQNTADKPNKQRRTSRTALTEDGNPTCGIFVPWKWIDLLSKLYCRIHRSSQMQGESLKKEINATLEAANSILVPIKGTLPCQQLSGLTEGKSKSSQNFSNTLVMTKTPINLIFLKLKETLT